MESKAGFFDFFRGSMCWTIQDLMPLSLCPPQKKSPRSMGLILVPFT